MYRYRRFSRFSRSRRGGPADPAGSKGSRRFNRSRGFRRFRRFKMSRKFRRFRRFRKFKRSWCGDPEGSGDSLGPGGSAGSGCPADPGGPGVFRRTRRFKRSRNSIGEAHFILFLLNNSTAAGHVIGGWAACWIANVCSSSCQVTLISEQMMRMSLHCISPDYHYGKIQCKKKCFIFDF